MRILCFGDSNTYGYDPRGFLGDRYDAENRWVDLLAKQTGCDFINAGSNGREIPRNPYPLQSNSGTNQAGILLVMLGTNDLLQGRSPEETAVRMEAFLQLQRPDFQQIFLIVPPPMKRGAWVPSDGLISDSLRLVEKYKDLAQRLNITLIDTRSWNIELTFDGVHFTENGHHTFAAYLRNTLTL